MISGRSAFEGKSAAAIVSAILQTEPSTLSTVRPESPPSLDHLVVRCVAKDPEERWQTIRDVKAELKWIAAERSKAASTAVPSTRVCSRFGLVVAATANAAGSAPAQIHVHGRQRGRFCSDLPQWAAYRLYHASGPYALDTGLGSR